MESFDLAGPLPVGTTLLEASAGTGKTFTVAALVTRYVAEQGVPLDQLLVITFGRAASQELRERVRDQLVQAERALADPASADRDHPVIAALLSEDVELRHRRLRDALASFDAATIATTHQFCQTVLRSLGVAGDTDTGATLVESLDDLVVEVVDDVYLRRFGHLSQAPPFGRDVALTLARTVVGDAHAVLAAAGDGRHGSPRPARGWTSPTRCGPRSTAASGDSGSCPTTTSSAGSPTRSPTTTRRPASGCGSGGRSCWSTSSRTPTPSSGRSSIAPSRATPPWR